MAPPFDLGGTLVTVLRAPLVTSTRDGSENRDWDNAAETDYSGCMIQPFLLSNKLQLEDNYEREFGASYFRVWMPAGSDVEYTDRLLINGQTYDVYGQPGRWYDFEGVESHVTVLAYLREG